MVFISSPLSSRYSTPSSSVANSPTSTIRSIDSGYAPSVYAPSGYRFKSPSTAPASLASPQRSPIACFPEITLRGSPKDIRDNSSIAGRRSRATSCASSISHKHRNPPRSPHETKILFDSAMNKATSDIDTVTSEIITRQSEIMARKHDIAVWQRKIHAAEKLLQSLEDQVQCLVVTAREKQDVEKELAAQRDAMMTSNTVSEKEWNALGVCLGDLSIENIHKASN